MIKNAFFTAVFLASGIAVASDLNFEDATTASQNVNYYPHVKVDGRRVLALSSVAHKYTMQDLNDLDLELDHADQLCKFLGADHAMSFTLEEHSDSVAVITVDRGNQFESIESPYDSVNRSPTFFLFDELSCAKSKDPVRTQDARRKFSNVSFEGMQVLAYTALDKMDGPVLGVSLADLPRDRGQRICRALGFDRLADFSIQERAQPLYKVSAEPPVVWAISGIRFFPSLQNGDFAVFDSLTCAN